MKLSLLLIALLAAPLHAEPVTPPAAQASVMSEGVVRKIDAANSKITLRHGPIVNLDMPGMTMVFRVQPPELLNAVKVGDTVKFHVEDINGIFTVTAIRVAP
ncbi:MAG: copper-binding protein [Thiobacillus sp.]